jgi:hypothetical protein
MAAILPCLPGSACHAEAMTGTPSGEHRERRDPQQLTARVTGNDTHGDERMQRRP